MPSGEVHFRVWAPRRTRVSVAIEHGPGKGHRFPLAREANGYFAGTVREARAGSRYRYQLDDAEAFPDPASRFQPDGPHGASEVVDPSTFRWTDSAWKGAPLAGQVLYEMHVGTFTREGTYEAAAREFPELARAGVTVLEVMPLAEFPGRFGWGYDGVDLFAPSHLYGAPDDLRRFVDRAHACGLGVILDVVYNHLGPDGNYLTQFAEQYFTRKYPGEWGDPVNFEGDDARPVREFFVANAGYWVDEFHFDGLRLDATQCIFDASPTHVLVEIGARVREMARGRDTLIVAENEPQDTRLVHAPERGGYGLDALWNDDLHHAAIVALTGKTEAYFTDYNGTPQEIVSAVKWGYLFQGQRYRWQKKRRGTPSLDLPAPHFVTFLENHDQIANSAFGRRLAQQTEPARLRAITALLLLAPGTPMLFQGQEFASSSPFLYFADHNPDLAALVRKGRGEFLAQFSSIGATETRTALDPPEDLATFERCKLDFTERAAHADVYALHQDLLRLRRSDPVFSAQRNERLHGAVLAAEAFVLRFLGDEGDDRLLVVNLGRDLRLDPAPEPLLGPPLAGAWKILWTSDARRYGGTGTPPMDTDDEGWRIPAHAAVVLAPDHRATESATHG